MSTRSVASAVQGALERMYRVQRQADVGDFVRPARRGQRESLLLREAPDGAIEIALRLPARGATGLDVLCQIIEGVSHFVYVAERARIGRATTRLELELQAEVDKWVVLAGSLDSFDARRSAELRATLYERVAFAHDAATPLGERYRVANDAAHGFVRRLERDYVGAARYGEMRDELRRFFQLGQEEKLRVARAA